MLFRQPRHVVVRFIGHAGQPVSPFPQLFHRFGDAVERLRRIVAVLFVMMLIDSADFVFQILRRPFRHRPVDQVEDAVAQKAPVFRKGAFGQSAFAQRPVHRIRQIPERVQDRAVHIE